MEKFENMQHNAVADTELDEVSGGRNIMDLFTAEFRGKKGKLTTLEMIPDAADEEQDFDITTLEMRENPLKKKKESPKVVKL